MAQGSSYRVLFRRRREGKTDYRARKALVISKIPRVVVRGSLKHVNVQVVEAAPTGDRVIVSANSQELKKYGWQAPCGNVPAAYMTGVLCGVRAVAKDVKKAVADIGLHQPTKGARIFASLKGVMDAGVEVPHDEGKMPDVKRLRGQHIADYAKNLVTSNIELYGKTFSQYLQNKLPPEKLPEHCDAVREKIAPPPSPKKETKRKSKKGEKP